MARKGGQRKSPKALHFKSKKNYQKWLAYNYIHNKKQMGKPPHKEIYIKGKKHPVNHSRKKSSRKRSSRKRR